jgi:glycerophosphoryl diester phosphodiesterase
MRSSPSGPDPLDPGPAGFAHRGLHGAHVPENSLAACSAALLFGAGIECDVRLTADQRIVVFHDADAVRLCGSPLRIGRSSFAEVECLDLGGESIPTLQAVLDLVGGRVPVLLEVKVDGDLSRWIAALAGAVTAYRGRVGVMSFDPRLVRLLRLQLPQLRRGLVIGANLSPFRRRLALSIAAPQFVAIDRAALSKPWVQSLRRLMPIYSWTIRTPEQRAQAQVQADALIWEADGRP